MLMILTGIIGLSAFSTIFYGLGSTKLSNENKQKVTLYGFAQYVVFIVLDSITNTIIETSFLG